MGRSWCFGVALALASAVSAGCGGGADGTSSSPAGAVVVSAITAPLFNAAPMPFTVTGAGFATLAGPTVTVRFTAASGTPFAGGTSASADVPGTVVSDTEVTGISPIGPGPTFAATVTVILPSTVEGSSAGAIATFLGISVDACAPVRVPADVPTPIVLTGNGFAPNGSACTIRFRAPTGTPFLGGTSATLDVPGTVNSLTQISGSTAVAGLASKLNARIEVLLLGGAVGGSVGPLLLFEVRPTAVGDAYGGAIGNVPFAVVAATGLASNDSDPDGDPLTVTAGTFPTTQGGTVTIAADGGFTYRSPLGFEGDDTFAYTVSDGFLTATGGATVSVNEVVWFVDSAAPPGGSGRFEAPFQTVAAFVAIQGAGPAPAQADDHVFLYDRGATYAGALTLLAGQRLWGHGEALVVGVTTIVPASTRPVLEAGAGATVTLSTGNQIRGITLSNTAGHGVVGVGFGTLLVRTSRVLATGGRALDLATGALDAQLVDVSSTASPAEGSLLVAVTGTLAISGTYAATDATTDGLRISGGSVATSIAAVSIAGPGGQGVELDGGTGLFQVDGGSIDDVGENGVRATSRAGAITLQGVTISNTGANAVPGQASHGVRLRECTGAVLVSACSFADMADNDPTFLDDNNGVDLVNTSGTLASLTVDACDFAGTRVGIAGTTTDHGVRVVAEGTARMSAVAFTDNTTADLDGGAIQVLLDADDSGDAPRIDALVVSDNPLLSSQGLAVEVRVDGAATLPDFRIEGNRILGDNVAFPTPGFSAAGGILVDTGEFTFGGVSTAVASGVIRNNDVDDVGDGAFDRGIEVLSQEGSTLTVTLDGNTIDGTAAEGLGVRSFDASTLTAVVTDNTLAATRPVDLLGSAFGDLFLNATQTSTLCVRVTGNVAPNLSLRAGDTSQFLVDGIAAAPPYSTATVLLHFNGVNTIPTAAAIQDPGATWGSCTIP